MTLLKIQPGHFDRDRDEGNEKQTVKLTRSFFLADREVSVGQFQKFLNDPDCPEEDKPADWLEDSGNSGPAANTPRNRADWYDAVLFCNWLSHQERRTPCYE